jgi:hypothetical protein
MGKGANRSCVELARGWFTPFHIFTASPDCITEHLNQYSASFGGLIPNSHIRRRGFLCLVSIPKDCLLVMIGKIAFEHGSAIAALLVLQQA